jgi:hypothetical protein
MTKLISLKDIQATSHPCVLARNNIIKNIERLASNGGLLLDVEPRGLFLKPKDLTLMEQINRITHELFQSEPAEGAGVSSDKEMPDRAAGGGDKTDEFTYTTTHQWPGTGNFIEWYYGECNFDNVPFKIQALKIFLKEFKDDKNNQICFPLSVVIEKTSPKERYYKVSVRFKDTNDISLLAPTQMSSTATPMSVEASSVTTGATSAGEETKGEPVVDQNWDDEKTTTHILTYEAPADKNDRMHDFSAERDCTALFNLILNASPPSQKEYLQELIKKRYDDGEKYHNGNDFADNLTPDFLSDNTSHTGFLSKDNDILQAWLYGKELTLREGSFTQEDGINMHNVIKGVKQLDDKPDSITETDSGFTSLTHHTELISTLLNFPINRNYIGFDWYKLFFDESNYNCKLLCLFFDQAPGIIAPLTQLIQEERIVLPKELSTLFDNASGYGGSMRNPESMKNFLEELAQNEKLDIANEWMKLIPGIIENKQKIYYVNKTTAPSSAAPRPAPQNIWYGGDDTRPNNLTPLYGKIELTKEEEDINKDEMFKDVAEHIFNVINQAAGHRRGWQNKKKGKIISPKILKFIKQLKGAQGASTEIGKDFVEMLKKKFENNEDLSPLLYDGAGDKRLAKSIQTIFKETITDFLSEKCKIGGDISIKDCYQIIRQLIPFKFTPNTFSEEAGAAAGALPDTYITLWTDDKGDDIEISKTNWRKALSKKPDLGGEVKDSKTIHKMKVIAALKDANLETNDPKIDTLYGGYMGLYNYIFNKLDAGDVDSESQTDTTYSIEIVSGEQILEGSDELYLLKPETDYTEKAKVTYTTTYQIQDEKNQEKPLEIQTLEIQTKWKKEYGSVSFGQCLFSLLIFLCIMGDRDTEELKGFCEQHPHHPLNNTTNSDSINKLMELFGAGGAGAGANLNNLLINLSILLQNTYSVQIQQFKQIEQQKDKKNFIKWKEVIKNNALNRCTENTQADDDEDEKKGTTNNRWLFHDATPANRKTFIEITDNFLDLMRSSEEKSKFNLFSCLVVECGNGKFCGDGLHRWTSDNAVVPALQGSGDKHSCVCANSESSLARYLFFMRERLFPLAIVCKKFFSFVCKQLLGSPSHHWRQWIPQMANIDPRDINLHRMYLEDICPGSKTVSASPMSVSQEEGDAGMNQGSGDGGRAATAAAVSMDEVKPDDADVNQAVQAVAAPETGAVKGDGKDAAAGAGTKKRAKTLNADTAAAFSPSSSRSSSVPATTTDDGGDEGNEGRTKRAKTFARGVDGGAEPAVAAASPQLVWDSKDFGDNEEEEEEGSKWGKASTRSERRRRLMRQSRDKWIKSAKRNMKLKMGGGKSRRTKKHQRFKKYTRSKRQTSNGSKKNRKIHKQTKKV